MSGVVIGSSELAAVWQLFLRAPAGCRTCLTPHPIEVVGVGICTVSYRTRVIPELTYGRHCTSWFAPISARQGAYWSCRIHGWSAIGSFRTHSRT